MYTNYVQTCHWPATCHKHTKHINKLRWPPRCESNLMPALQRCRAAERPAMPAPMTRTSTWSVMFDMTTPEPRSWYLSIWLTNWLTDSNLLCQFCKSWCTVKSQGWKTNLCSALCLFCVGLKSSDRTRLKYTTWKWRFPSLDLFMWDVDVRHGDISTYIYTI